MVDFSSKLKEIGNRAVTQHAAATSLLSRPSVSRPAPASSVLGDISPQKARDHATSLSQIAINADWRNDEYQREQAKQIPRSGGEVFNDTTRSVLGGISSGTSSLVNFAQDAGEFFDSVYRAEPTSEDSFAARRIEENRLKLIDNKAAVRAFSNRIVDNAKKGQSSQLKVSNEVAEIDTEIQGRSILEDFEKSDKTLSDALKREARLGISRLSVLKDNPQAAGDVTANALGSLVPSGLLTGGTSTFTQGGLKAAGAGIKTTKAVTGIAAAGSVGVVEGAGAYGSTYDAVISKSHNELLAGSDQYASFIQSGKDPEVARKLVADLAGRDAQKKQTAIAGTIGLLPGASKLDINPLKNVKVPGIVAETLEEAAQSATGELSGNSAIKKFADREQDILEGTGRAGADGALGGFGATTTIQSPHLLRDATSVIGNKVGNSAKFVVGQLSQIAETKADLKNPNGEAATSSRIKDLEGIINDAAATDINNETRTVTRDVVDLVSALPTELLDTKTEEYITTTTALPEVVQKDLVEGSRLQSVRKLAAKLKQGAYTGEAEAQVASFVASEIATLEEYVALNKSTEEVPQNGSDSAARVIAEIVANKGFQDGKAAADGILNPPTPESETDSSEAAPVDSSPATIKEVVTDPVAVDPARAKEALATGGHSPAEAAALRIAESINIPETVKDGSGRSETRQELLFDGSNKGYGKVPSFSQLISVAVKGAIKVSRGGDTEVAIENGNAVDANDSVVRLRNLAQHQINKFEAAVSSRTQQEADPDNNVSSVKYETLDPRTGDTFFPISRGNEVFYDANNAESIETFNQIREDANVGIDAYNKLLEEYPSVYKGEPLARIPEGNTNAQTTKPEAARENSDRNTPVVGSEQETLRPESQGSGGVDTSGNNQTAEQAETDTQGVESETDIRETSENSGSTNIPVVPTSDSSSNNDGRLDSLLDIIKDIRGDVDTIRNVNNTPKFYRELKDLNRDIKTGNASPSDIDARIEKLKNEVAKQDFLGPDLNQNTKDKAAAESFSRSEKNDRSEATRATDTQTQTASPQENVTVALSDGVNEDTSSSSSTEEVTLAQSTAGEAGARAVGDNLVKNASGKSTFQETYDVEPLLAPEDDIIDMVESESAAERLDYEFDGEKRNALINILGDLDNVAAELNKRLQSGILKPYSGKPGTTTLADILADNNAGIEGANDVTRIRIGRILSLVDAQSLADGKPVLDEYLVGLALMATADYVLNTPNSGGIYKDADIAKTLGIKDGQITQEMRDLVNFGRPAGVVKEDLARHIKTFWGAKDNVEASVSDTRGIAEALADEIIATFDARKEDNAWFERRTLNGEGRKIKIGDKTPGSIRIGNISGDLGSATTILRDLLIDNNSDSHQYSIGEKFSKSSLPTTLKKDKDLTLSEGKVSAVEKQMNTEYKLSEGFADMYEAFGEATIAKILGFVDIDPDNNLMNDNHRASVEGKNLSIMLGIDGVRDQMQRVRDYAAVKGQEVKDVAIHYRFEISANGRFFMQGFNPQSNKLARELFSPNQTTLDLNKSGDVQVMLAAVAQAMDEIKIENTGLEGAAVWAQEAIDGKFRTAIDVIKTQGDPQALVDALAGRDIERSARLLKALYTVSNYEKALAAGDTSLDIDLPLELDGKTNGPISGAIQNNTAEFSEDMLALYRRGGLFVGNTAQTPNDYSELNSADLYEAVGQLKSRKLGELSIKLRKGQLTARNDTSSIEAGGRAQILILELLNELGDVDFTPRNGDQHASLQVKRKGTKSPITQQLYGSGEKSIAAGITNSIFKMIYEEISDARESKQFDRLNKLAGLIDELTAIKTSQNFKTKELRFVNEGGVKFADTRGSKAMSEFSFNEQAFGNLTAALQHLYVPAFTAALEDTVGSSVSALNSSMVNGTNASTNIYLSLINSAIEAEQAAQVTSGKLRKGAELSKKDRNKILAQFKKFAPIIDVGDTVFNLSSGTQESSTEVDARRAKQKKDGKAVETRFGPRSETLGGIDPLTGEWRTTRSDSKRDALSDAGVKVLPNNVISNADVSMVTDTVNDPEFDAQNLIVHDGFETTLTGVSDTSRIINKTIQKSWQTNTIDPVLRHLKGVAELRGEFANTVDPTLIEDLDTAIAQLEEASILRQAKIEALTTVQMTVDGAPGAQAPFVIDTGLSFDNDADLVAHLNSEMSANVARIRAEKAADGQKTVSDRVELEGSIPSAFREAFGNGFDGDPKTFITVLEGFVTNADQNKVLAEIKASPALQDIIDAGLSVVIEDNTDTGGRYDMDSNTLYISNMTPETAVHELVHAATAHQVMSHYLAPDITSDRGRAVTRLESLMNDMVSRTYAPGSIEAHVQAEIQQGLDQGGVNGQVAALNEFMAWSLSNQELISNNKQKLALNKKSGAKSLGKKAISMMRRILGFVSNKTFDHILFNTTIILNSDNTVSKNTRELSGVVLNQNLRNDPAPSEDSLRQQRLQELFDNQITAFLQVRKIHRTAEGSKTSDEVALEANNRSEEAFNRVIAAGFNIDNKRLFKSLAATFSVDFQTNKIARLEAQRMFDAVVNKISAESFLIQMGTTQAEASQQQRIDAEALHAAATGLIFENPAELNSLLGPVSDVNGNSDRLGVFLALSQTSPELRDILSGFDFKDLGLKEEYRAGNIDDVINNVTRFSLQNVTSLAIRGTRKGAEAVTADQAMDTLAELLTVIDQEAASNIENKASGFARRVNNGIKNAVEKSAEKVSDTATEAASAVNGSKGVLSLAGILLSTVAKLADLFSESRAASQADSLTATLQNSKVPHAIREVFSEARGMTPSTTDVYKLVKLAKEKVSSIREEYRSSVPKILANAFSDEFNNAKVGVSRKDHKARVAQDWNFMFQGFGKADITAVIASLGEGRAFSLFGTNSAAKVSRDKARAQLQGRIAKSVSKLGLAPALEAKVVAAYSVKAEQLGSFLSTGVVGNNLLRSAESIAGLYNEGGLSLTAAESLAFHKAVSEQRSETDNAGYKNSGVFRDLVRQLDALASVEAIDALDQATHSRLDVLLGSEIKGIRYTLSYMKDLRAQEVAKTDHAGAKINGYKGFMPTDTKRKYSVIIANNADHDALVKLGYTRMRAYNSAQSQLTRNHAPQSYYFSTSSGLANFNQGALQTVQQSYNGVDPTTGITQGSFTGGTSVTGDAAKNLNRKMKSSRIVLGDAMLPVFSEYGDLIGFEAAIAPDMQRMLEPQNNFAESLGNWAGRIVEEQVAEGFNQDLIDALYENYNNAEDKSQYVEFSDTSEDLGRDKIWQDNWKLIPKNTKKYAEVKFGGPLMVRKDMINNALGYRSASVGDIFTGQTRMNDDVRKLMRDAAISVPFLGNNAYKFLTSAESAVQTIVSEVKHTIVVKSGIIMAANELSNNVQLLGREVPVSYIIKKKRTKYAELSQYVKNQSIKVKLRADKLAAQGQTEKDTIQSRIDAIEESESRMSIAPLLQSGEYTTISDGLTSQDTDLINGNFVDAIEEAIANLPGPLSTVGRYAIVSKDTALYKLLAKGVQYSDFTSKAIYYDFITENKGLSQKDALNRVTEEFINYDLADGRTRNYAESVGLTWFLNFKIRAIKIAIDIVRNNPLTALLTLGGAGALGMEVGSTVTDNAAAVAADGRLGYSVGPGMTQAAWSLNIWRQLFG